MVPGWVPFKIVSDSPALQVKMNSNFNCSYMARSSLTYIPFLAHLAFRPCELLPSLFVRRQSVNILHFNLLLRNHWANCNQTLVEWSLGGLTWQLCPVIPTSNQDGSQAKNRKNGGWNLKKIFSETTEPISTKLCWNDLWVVPFQNCVRHFRPPMKMAATAELKFP